MITGTTPFGGPAAAEVGAAALEFMIFENITNYVEGTKPLHLPESIAKITPDGSAKNIIESFLRVDAKARLGGGTDDENSENGYGHLKGHEFWGDYVKWGSLLDMTPPHTPDPTNFPSSADLADGADDEWMIEGEATIIEDSVSAIEIQRKNSRCDPAIMRDVPGRGSSYSAIGGGEKGDHWTSFLHPGEAQLFSGIIVKRKGLFSRNRLLVLTDHPRLFYVDPDDNTMKGEIPWTAQSPVQCSILDDNKFDILSTHDPSKRVYHLTSWEAGSAAWVDLINAMVQKQIEAR
jgi:3-phosphoinositide dependent protein kinase-1